MCSWMSVIHLQLTMERPERHRCYLYYNATIVQQPIDLSQLTSTMVDDAKTFLYKSQDLDEPFFLYFSFPQTHSSMMNNPRFTGSSRRGTDVAQTVQLSVCQFTAPASGFIKHIMLVSNLCPVCHLQTF